RTSTGTCRVHTFAIIIFCSTSKATRSSLRPTRSPNVTARLEARLSTRSARSLVCSASWTITDYVAPPDMLAELREDNKELAARLRETHSLCEEHGDFASASLIEVWIDEAERRTWFLFE